MSGEGEDHYFISYAGREDSSELESLLHGMEGVNVQYHYATIKVIAAEISERTMVERLQVRGYRVEPQHYLRQLDAENLPDIVE